MPLTTYVSIKDIPPFEDYTMTGKTYRYFSGTPLYEFGYGLSFATFKYSNLTAPKNIKTNENIKVSIEVQNTGKVDGDEVVQLYIKSLDAKVPVPIHALQGFKRVFLKAGEKKTVEFELKPEQLSVIDNDNRRIIEPGRVQVFIGGCQPSKKAVAAGKVIKAEFSVAGRVNVIE